MTGRPTSSNLFTKKSLEIKKGETYVLYGAEIRDAGKIPKLCWKVRRLGG